MTLEAQEISDLNLTGLVVRVTSGCFDTIHSPSNKVTSS